MLARADPRHARPPDKLNSVGRPTPGVEVIICDDDAKQLDSGNQGEGLARGTATHRALLEPAGSEPRALQRALVAHRRRRQPGRRRLPDLPRPARRPDQLRRAELLPAEVEKELGPIPGVTEYLIAGVPDPRGILEHVAWAFVVPENPDTWSPKELHAQARRRLPPHMVPRQVVAIPSMPLIAVGKPDRRGVVAKYGPQAKK